MDFLRQLPRVVLWLDECGRNNTRKPLREAWGISLRQLIGGGLDARHPENASTNRCQEKRGDDSHASLVADYVVPTIDVGDYSVVLDSRLSPTYQIGVRMGVLLYRCRVVSNNSISPHRIVISGSDARVFRPLPFPDRRRCRLDESGTTADCRLPSGPLRF